MLIKQYKDLVNALLCANDTDNDAVGLQDEFIFSLKYDDIAQFRREYVVQAGDIAFNDIEINKKFPLVTSKDRFKTFHIEAYERDMIINDLKFATHINISKFNEPITSRRFVTTNDSCLSFAQITVDPTSYRWTFVSRSTEVNKMLPVDLVTIGMIIQYWTNWFEGYTYSGKDVDTNKMGVKVLIVLNNPHYFKK